MTRYQLLCYSLCFNVTHFFQQAIEICSRDEATLTDLLPFVHLLLLLSLELLRFQNAKINHPLFLLNSMISSLHGLKCWWSNQLTSCNAFRQLFQPPVVVDAPHWSPYTFYNLYNNYNNAYLFKFIMGCA